MGEKGLSQLTIPHFFFFFWNRFQHGGLGSYTFSHTYCILLFLFLFAYFLNIIYIFVIFFNNNYNYIRTKLNRRIPARFCL